jgi:tetratricopeptide (TPR) repeat protein
MTDFSLWGLEPAGYHLTNILLHILVALSIGWFAYILFKDYFVSFLASLFFVIHPIHTEAVSYISGRAESLSTFFILLSFIFYIKYIKRNRLAFYILFSVSFALSLLSKESSLILLVMLLIYHYVFKRKINRVAFASYGVIAFVYIALRLTVLNFGSYQAFSKVPLTERIAGFFYAFPTYIRLLIWPSDLHMEYGIIRRPPDNPFVLLGMFMFVLFLIAAFKIRRHNKLVSFSIFFFIAGLIPVCNIYPLNATLAEHWLYLPSIGFFIIIAWLLTSLYRKRKFTVFSIILIITAASSLSYLTVKQNRYWQDPVYFYKRTLKYNPKSPRLYANLARLYWQEGRYEEAVRMCKKAIEIDPAHFVAYNNLGNAYLQLGEYEKAKSSFKKAASLKPEHPTPYGNLGWTYFLLDDHDKASKFYRKAIELKPNYSAAYYNLAILYYEKGNYELALKYCHKAEELGHKIKPEFLKALEKHTVTK